MKQMLKTFILMFFAISISNFTLKADETWKFNTRGLINRGATCYLNSAIQALSNIKTIMDVVNRTNYKDYPLAEAFVTLAEELKPKEPSRTKAINPKNFCNLFFSEANKSLRKKGGIPFTEKNQQDSAEALNFIFNRLLKPISDEDFDKIKAWKESGEKKRISDELLKIARKKVNLTTRLNEELFNLIKIKQSSTISSENNTNRDKTNELMLGLQVADNQNLESLLKEYLKTESLTDYKDKNNKIVPATKQIKIENAPNVFIVHLKIYDNTLKKTRNKVSIPTQLNSSIFCKNPLVQNKNYILRSMIVHQGSHINGGHYYCLVQTDEGKWIQYDDSVVLNLTLNGKTQQKINIEDYLNGNSVAEQESPYILFYENIATKSISPKPQTESVKNSISIIASVSQKSSINIIADQIRDIEATKQQSENYVNTLLKTLDKLNAQIEDYNNQITTLKLLLSEEQAKKGAELEKQQAPQKAQEETERKQIEAAAARKIKEKEEERKKQQAEQTQKDAELERQRKEVEQQALIQKQQEEAARIQKEEDLKKQEELDRILAEQIQREQEEQAKKDAELERQRKANYARQQEIERRSAEQVQKQIPTKQAPTQQTPTKISLSQEKKGELKELFKNLWIKRRNSKLKNKILDKIQKILLSINYPNTQNIISSLQNLQIKKQDDLLPIKKELGIN